MTKRQIVISKFNSTVDGIDHLYKKVTIYHSLKTMTELQAAIRNACTDFIHTEQGNALYHQNQQTFSWTDFILHVPDHINQKYGFQVQFSLERILDTTPYVQVDWFENLINPQIPISFQQWINLKYKLLNVQNLNRTEQIQLLLEKAKLPVTKVRGTEDMETTLETIREWIDLEELRAFYQEL